MPGMVYISQPTEYGTLYSLEELTALSETCRKYHLPLYADGARLAYALASPENDVTLKDLARLCDVFYIGGTKCGAFFGEAVVIPDPALIDVYKRQMVCCAFLVFQSSVSTDQMMDGIPAFARTALLASLIFPPGGRTPFGAFPPAATMASRV